MNLKKLADLIGFRRLRSGSIFSEFYVVPNPDFDLNALGLAAAENEQDEPPPSTDDDEKDGGWEDINDGGDESPLSSAPATPPSKPSPESSPLSSLSPSPRSSRPSSPLAAPSAREEAGPSHAYAIKGGGRKRRKKAHGREARKKRRRLEAQDLPERKRRTAQHVARASAKRVDFDLKKARVASTGFRGLYEEQTLRTHTLEELLEEGFTYYGYNGLDVTPIVAPLAPEPDPKAPQDAPLPPPEDVVVAVLAGQPKDGEGSGHANQVPFRQAHETLADAIREQGKRATFAKDAREHRRGCFGAQAEGISHGGGQLQPARLKHSAAMTLVLMCLISLPAMVRIAHFASSAFATWAPAIHKYYDETLATLLASDPSLYRNFPRSVWSCITINFGPKTVTFPHRDYGNLPFGWHLMQ